MTRPLEGLFLLTLPISYFITRYNNCPPFPFGKVYNGHIDNELVMDTRPKGNYAHE